MQALIFFPLFFEAEKKNMVIGQGVLGQMMDVFTKQKSTERHCELNALMTASPQIQYECKNHRLEVPSLWASIK